MSRLVTVYPRDPGIAAYMCTRVDRGLESPVDFSEISEKSNIWFGSDLRFTCAATAAVEKAIASTGGFNLPVHNSSGLQACPRRISRLHRKPQRHLNDPARDTAVHPPSPSCMRYVSDASRCTLKKQSTGVKYCPIRIDGTWTSVTFPQIIILSSDRSSLTCTDLDNAELTI